MGTWVMGHWGRGSMMIVDGSIKDCELNPVVQRHGSNLWISIG